MPASSHRPIAHWLAGWTPPALLLLLGLVVRPQSRAVQVALLLALLATLTVAADRLVGWLLPQDRSVERALDAGVIAVALAIFTTTALGHLGGLSESTFFASIGGIALLVSFVPSRRHVDDGRDVVRSPLDADDPSGSVAADTSDRAAGGARRRAERTIATFALATIVLLVARDLDALAADSRAVVVAGPGLLALLAVAGATVALVGGYTYLRNWVALGNPIFPQEVSVFGFRLWQGWPWAGLGRRQQWPDAAIEPWRFLWDRRDLFGPWSRWTLLPAAIVAPFLALFHSSRRDAPGASRVLGRMPLVATFLLPATLFAEFLFLMHDHRDLRYVAAGVGLAAVAFAWCVEQLPPRGARLVAGAFAVAIAGEMGLRRGPFGLAVALFGVATLLAVTVFAQPAWLRPALRYAVVGAPLLLASIALLGAPSFFWRYAEEREQGQLFAAQAVFERTLGPAVRTLAYVGGNQPYPFFGSRLQHRVEIVPTAGAAALRHYGWRGAAKLPYGRRAWRTWSANLEKLAVDAVVVVRGTDEEPERGWIVEHPERFERLASVESIELWRVRRAVTGAAPGVDEAR